MRLPPLPRALWSPHGEIRVQRGGTAADELGHYEYDTRTIRVRARLRLAVAWPTLWHEWAHAVLADYQVRMPEEAEEAVCDALGSARMAEFARAVERHGPAAALAAIGAR